MLCVNIVQRVSANLSTGSDHVLMVSNMSSPRELCVNALLSTFHLNIWDNSFNWKLPTFTLFNKIWFSGSYKFSRIISDKSFHEMVLFKSIWILHLFILREHCDCNTLSPQEWQWCQDLSCSWRKLANPIGQELIDNIPYYPN